MGNVGTNLGNVVQQNNLNVLMFGMENAGKTHLLYTGLVGNGTLASIESQIQPTQGFNCEYVVGTRESFTVWDIGGHPYNREFWPNYVENIPASVIIYVVNANECIERLRESKRLLHTLMIEYAIANANLIVIFNTTLKQQKGMEIYHEQPFKPAYLEKVFKLDKIKQPWRTFEFDVNDQEQCNQMFDYVSSLQKIFLIKTKQKYAGTEAKEET